MGRIETEDVPADKRMHQSTRGNSMYKWMKGNVVGALEVASEPELDYREDLVPHSGNMEQQEAFERAQDAWDSLKLHASFVAACEAIPPETCFCGLIADEEETKKTLVRELNKSWAEDTNKKLAPYNIKLDVFLWVWHNISGKSESRVILIRFHDITQS